MADNDQYDDEYQFADLDEINPDFSEESENATPDFEMPERSSGITTKNIRRNALIVLGVVILAMIIYKLAEVFWDRKEETTKTSIPPVATATKTPVQIQEPVKPVPTPAPPAPTEAVSPEINQKISALELGQQTTRSDINTMNNQLSEIRGSISELTEKINELNQTLSNLASRVDEQSREINVLTVRTKPKVVKHIVRKAKLVRKYYIQAIIPGRAWLISTNGTTLTVREGTPISGYGVVKLIDPLQGRVITTTGTIIRFSQTDS